MLLNWRTEWKSFLFSLTATPQQLSVSAKITFLFASHFAYLHILGSLYILQIAISMRSQVKPITAVLRGLFFYLFVKFSISANQIRNITTLWTYSFSPVFCAFLMIVSIRLWNVNVTILLCFLMLVIANWWSFSSSLNATWRLTHLTMLPEFLSISERWRTFLISKLSRIFIWTSWARLSTTTIFEWAIMTVIWASPWGSKSSFVLYTIQLLFDIVKRGFSCWNVLINEMAIIPFLN